MPRGDDVSGEHFQWLVAGRSHNLQATLDLYTLIDVNSRRLEKDVACQNIADQLVGTAFSLWRAVFLTDLTGDVVDQVTDLKKFMQSLIAHNTVLYQTDFTAREWTFSYYLDNAISRLMQLPDQILPLEFKAGRSGSAKDDWTNAQAMLDTAITNFAEMISDPS